MHRPELETPPNEEQKARFEQTAQVVVQARNRFPGGVLVENPPWDFVGALKKTKELLSAQAETLFEAAFEYKGLFARADVLKFSRESGRWLVYEVKSSLKPRPEHLQDLSLLAWILANSGLPIEKISLLHLNPEFEFPKSQDLFCEIDVTENSRKEYLGMAQRLNQLLSTMKNDNAPVSSLGPQCLEPYECSFKKECWKASGIPELSLFQLPQIRERQWQLYAQGIVDLTDSRLDSLTPLQEKIVASHRKGERQLDREGLRTAVMNWKFPLFFLDFETLNPAVPAPWGGRPYMQIPFQFSVHVWKSAEAELEHYEFLHEGPDDPRPALIKGLLKACHGEGPIVAYFAKFESDRIRELAESFPEHAEELERLRNRLVDPLPLLRESVYDPAFQGSFSLKKVGPALLGSAFSYDGLAVKDGRACQRAYEELLSPSTSADRKKRLRHEILEYCKRDTFILVELVKWIQQI